jgi:hypothetical protein
MKLLVLPAVIVAAAIGVAGHVSVDRATPYSICVHYAQQHPKRFVSCTAPPPARR